MTEPAGTGDDTDRQVLVVFAWPEGKPDLQAVARRLNVPDSAFDADFGVVLLDTVRGLWSARARYEDLPAELGAGVWIAGDPPIHGEMPGD